MYKLMPFTECYVIIELNGCVASLEFSPLAIVLARPALYRALPFTFVKILRVKSPFTNSNKPKTLFIAYLR